MAMLLWGKMMFVVHGPAHCVSPNVLIPGQFILYFSSTLLISKDCSAIKNNVHGPLFSKKKFLYITTTFDIAVLNTVCNVYSITFFLCCSFAHFPRFLFWRSISMTFTLCNNIINSRNCNDSVVEQKLSKKKFRVLFFLCQCELLCI